jgi:hypothetical protein
VAAKVPDVTGILKKIFNMTKAKAAFDLTI